MPFERLSIIGVGLLGGSLGKAAKSSIKHCKIIGYGHRKSTLDRAMEIGAIDEAADNLADAVRNCDLVVLCTPVGLFREVLASIGPNLAPGAIVTDVGSTKRSVVRLAQEILPKNVSFVGSHPMAGSEKRGVEFARADLYRGALCILTPTGQTDPAALDRVQEFWTTLGMRTAQLSPDDHDRLLADVSHLPHVIAAALIAMQQEPALGLAGKGFLDTTRIGSGDGGLWRDILLDNRDNLRASISHLCHDLQAVQSLLDSDNAEAIKTWLDNAAARREALVQRKLQEMDPG